MAMAAMYGERRARPNGEDRMRLSLNANWRRRKRSFEKETSG